MLRKKVIQLEAEVERLQNIIIKEKSNSNELKISLKYYQELYKRERNSKDDDQSVFNKGLGSL